MHRYLSFPESSGNDSWKAIQHENESLLRAWAKLKLTTGSWKDALAAAVGVSPRVYWYLSFA